ncbi:hypothetical protein [Bifidobacterium cuniculi]|uniref:hypothetical protein n=1 Tax=Bifidobacterium cuniculi TaxID=1688 RepID=UPI00052A02AA|nr:hypothetical protein [Bifidobacterium cuniculi]
MTGRKQPEVDAARELRRKAEFFAMRNRLHLSQGYTARLASEDLGREVTKLWVVRDERPDLKYGPIPDDVYDWMAARFALFEQSVTAGVAVVRAAVAAGTVEEPVPLTVYRGQGAYDLAHPEEPYPVEEINARKWAVMDALMAQGIRTVPVFYDAKEVLSDERRGEDADTLGRAD